MHIQETKLTEQIGGTHYSKYEYQTWDFIHQIGLDYFLGNALKYITRYPDKNGIEDIKKAVSYIDKYLDLNKDITLKPIPTNLITRFVSQFNETQARLIRLLVRKQFKELKESLNELL